LRSTERRITAEGRRATDRRDGAPAWLRVGILALVLVIAVGMLLFTREVAQPGVETDSLRLEAVDREAQILALEVERLIAPVQVAARAATRSPGASAAQIAAQAHAAVPDVGFAVIADSGRVQATAGGRPEAFATSEASSTLASDGQHLLVSRELAGGARLVGRVALPALQPRDGAQLWLMAGSATVLKTSAADVKGLGLAVRPIRADGQADQLKIGDNNVRRTAVAIADTNLIAVATTGATAGSLGWLNDSWIFIIPAGLGLAVIALVLLVERRQQSISKAWAASEQRFRGAVEAARCGVWEWDTEAEIITVSDFMAGLLGLEEGGSLPVKTVLAQIHHSYHDAVLHALQQSQMFGTFEVSFPVPDAKGKARWIDARGQARGERGDAGFTSVLGIALDTTEARRSKAQAQAAEMRLRDGIESVSDAFVLFDKGGRLILSNQAFQDTFDFGEGVLRRGAFKQDLNQIAALAIKSDQPATGGREGAREIELNDGRWLQLVERQTSDGGSVVTAADITAIKLKEAERQRATDALHTTITELEDREDKLRLLARKYEVAMTRAEAANQAKSEFLANMSHELRTPLNAINGFSEIMSNEMFGPLGHAKYKGYAADILKSGQHLLSLINDVLDMAKIEAGKVTLYYERVSLKEIVTDAALLMRGKIEEAGLKLIIDAPDLPDIEADQRGLKQVMLNLISNAVKFTPEGGDIVVAVSQQDDERLRVAVTDTGIGIAAKDLSRLAQPFEQVEGQHSKTTQGTGLGLALTKSLIELHGGKLVMQSEPGRGTTVSFDVPIKRPATASETVQPAQARAA
jgi:two-component system cell cycle sensor histidine kinase PleC